MTKQSVLFVILAAFAWTPVLSQHVLTKANALMRSGDIVRKQLVAYVPPGESGMNASWDFRNIDQLADLYQIEYTKDSSSSLQAIDSSSMHLYRLRGDTLTKVSYQNPLTHIEYSVPIPELNYPFSYGDTLCGNYKGEGRYCSRNGISIVGTTVIEADGEGTLTITDECTLRDALRVHTLRTSSFGVAKDSVPADSANRLLEVEESYRWYAKGYRYPLFETCSTAYYHGTKLLSSCKTAYRTLPDSLRILADSVNMELERRGSHLAKSDNIITYKITHEGQSVRADYNLTERATVSSMITNPMESYIGRAAKQMRREKAIPYHLILLD